MIINIIILSTFSFSMKKHELPALGDLKKNFFNLSVKEI